MTLPPEAITIRDNAGEECAQRFAWWLRQTGLFDEISDDQCLAMSNAFAAGWLFSAYAERDRIRQVLAEPESEWRFAGPALEYFADLLREPS